MKYSLPPAGKSPGSLDPPESGEWKKNKSGHGFHAAFMGREY